MSSSVNSLRQIPKHSVPSKNIFPHQAYETEDIVKIEKASNSQVHKNMTLLNHQGYKKGQKEYS